MSPIPEKCLLLNGPYHAPPLSRGDRATCLLRDGDVIVTGWTDCRISWPRCRLVGSKGGSGVLLDEELARAVRNESAAAICYWWGVHTGVVWRWRKALDVTRVNNAATHKLIKASAQVGAEAIKEKVWTEAELAAYRERSKQLNLGQHLWTGFHGPCWTAKEKELLGKLPDAEVALRTGRTRNAVRVQRVKLRMPNLESPVWTAAEIGLLGTMPPKEVAAKTGRTLTAVYQKLHELRNANVPNDDEGG